MSPEKKVCEKYGLTPKEMNAAICRVDGVFDQAPSDLDQEISDAYTAALEEMFDSFPVGWENAGPAAITTLLMHDYLVSEGIDPDEFKARLKGEL